MSVPNWDFFGSTMVTSNFIRLTSDTQSQRGSLWNQVVSVFVCYYVANAYWFKCYANNFFLLTACYVTQLGFSGEL